MPCAGTGACVPLLQPVLQPAARGAPRRRRRAGAFAAARLCANALLLTHPPRAPPQFAPLSAATQDRAVMGLRGVVSAPAGLESASLMLAVRGAGAGAGCLVRHTA